MDLTVALRLRAQTEGISAIKAMRQETAELAAAMKEVRAAARAGGQVSPGAIRALGGFDEFQQAFAKAQRELTAGVRSVQPFDEEKAFRGDIRALNARSKVRLAEAARVAKAEVASAKEAAAAQKREAEGVLAFKMRMNAQMAREAQAEAATEARAAQEAAAAEQRAAEQSVRTAISAWRRRAEAAKAAESAELRAATQHAAAMRRLVWGIPGFGGGGHGRRGRGIMGEIGLAAEYTLTYGAINEALRGVGAVASSPYALARMTMGVADQARETKENAQALGVSATDYQGLRYAFAGRGLGEERVQPMLQFMEKSAVGAVRGIKSETVAFRALGLSMRQLKADSHNPMKLLLEIGDRLEAIRNPSKRVAIADMIFGREGSKYLPLFDHGYLRNTIADAAASKASISDSDLAEGQRVAAQWRELGMQVAGIKNETASALFPIMSRLLGDASSWLRENRATISSIIKNDVAELKADLLAIERGFKNIANASLQIARDLAPALHAMTAFSKSGFAKYMFSGQLLPGLDLGDPKNRPMGRDLSHNAMTLHGAARDFVDLDQAAARLASAIAAKIEVHIHAAPGVAVGATTARGAPPPTIHRGQVHAGG